MFTRQELFILQGALMQRLVRQWEELETIKDSGATNLIATMKRDIANLNTLRDKVKELMNTDPNPCVDTSCLSSVVGY